jgi:hypothetical protein
MCTRKATSKAPRPLAQVHQRRPREQLPRLHQPAVDYYNNAAAASLSPTAVAPLQPFSAPRRCPVAASVLHQQHRAPRLLISRSHGFYINYVDFVVRRDYSSSAARALHQPRRAPRLLVSGRTCSTSTSPCAATTRLQPHALYVDLAVRRNYSSPAAHALRQPRHAPRVLVITLPPAAIYLDSAARPGASARRAARHAARRAAHRRLLRLAQARRRLRHCASGCLGTSRGSSRGSSRRSSSTTPHRPGSLSTTPSPRVRVPRHVARLVTRLVAPLVFDYSASPRLVVDYSTARPGASACCAARHAARRAARRRLLRFT